jgi:hypothetical protein
MIPRIAVLFVAVGAVAAAFAAPAIAGKGGNKGNGASAPTAAWVTASPGSVASGERVYLRGCGYDFSPVEVRIIHSAGYTQTYLVGMWSTGCMDGAFFTSAEAGTYLIEVYQSSSGTSSHLMASTSVNVG